MSRLVRRTGLVALVGLALPLLVASAASAEKEFTGKVDKISAKKIFVDNRMGDKLTFMKADSVTVEGEKTEWDKIKKGDRVTVWWKIMDNPRKAYKVVVLPPKEE